MQMEQVYKQWNVVVLKKKNNSSRIYKIRCDDTYLLLFGKRKLWQSFDIS